MNIEKLIELIKQLKENYENGDKYLDSIPSDIRSSFYDNEYVDSLYKNLSLLLNAVVEDEFLSEEIRMFICNYSSCFPYYVDGKKIETEEEFYDFIRNNYESI